MRTTLLHVHELSLLLRFTIHVDSIENSSDAHGNNDEARLLRSLIDRIHMIEIV